MQFFGIEEIIKPIVQVSSTLIEWPAGSNIRIGGQAYNVTSTLTLDTTTDIDTGTLAGDTTYYVYAVVVSNVVDLKYSLSSDAPTGYSAYRLIGNFRSDPNLDVSSTTDSNNLSIKVPIFTAPTIDSLKNYFTAEGSPTPPILATNPLIDRYIYWREGRFLVVNFSYAHDNNAGASDGSSSDYCMLLPNGLSIDNNYIVKAAGSSSVYHAIIEGAWHQSNSFEGSGSYSNMGQFGRLDGNNIALSIRAVDYANTAPNAALWVQAGSNDLRPTSVTLQWSGWFRVPIDGWTETE